jgi:hypothetical protein
MVLALQGKSITIELVVLQVLNNLGPQLKLPLSYEALGVAEYVKPVLGARQSDTDPVGGFEEPDLSEVVGANQRQKDDFILLALVVVHVDHLDLPHFLPINLVIIDEGLYFEELPRIKG